MTTRSKLLDAYELSLLSLVVLSAALTSIHPTFPDQTALQHIPTAIAVVALACTRDAWPLSRTSFTLAIAFLLLHVIGARYSYSFVPYDEWTERLFGFTLTRRFGWSRNHYDRLVHFLFGVLITPVARELCERKLGTSRRASLLLALCFIMSASMFYEIVEWALTFALAPEQAATYNGQQGDAWDSQKDMALAVAGSLCSIVALAIGGVFARRSHARS